MEQICCKKNLGPGKGNKVLQVLRKMIATRFEKKSRFSKKRGKLPSFNFGIEWLFFFWSFSKDSTSGFKAENDCN